MDSRAFRGAGAGPMGGSGGSADNDEADNERESRLKQRIREALSRRVRTEFASLTYQAINGGLDEVAMLLRRGADVNMADYDQRTTLHRVAATGNNKVGLVQIEIGRPMSLKGG